MPLLPPQIENEGVTIGRENRPRGLGVVMFPSQRTHRRAVLPLVPCLLLLAQTALRREDHAAPVRPSAASRDELDQYLVARLKTEHQHAIALARIAQRQSTNRHVRDFANQTVEFHSDRFAQLQALSHTLGDSTVDNLVRINAEVAQRRIATAHGELKQRRGADFDKSFLEMQAKLHERTADMLTTCQNHASARLQAIIAVDLQSTQQHLEEARRILRQLDWSPVGSAGV